MATGGDKKQVSGNVSDGNMTQEEIDQLVKTLSAMKVKTQGRFPRGSPILDARNGRY